MSLHIQPIPPATIIRALVLVLLVMLVASTIGCKKSGGGSGCAALDATAFGCADPNDCLAVITTWNYPGASSTASSDLDLSLDIGGSANQTVAYNNTPHLGCRHGGDEMASTPLEETAETVICDPPQVDADYRFHWYTFFDIPIRVDVNDHGTVSCSIRDNIADVTLFHP